MDKKMHYIVCFNIRNCQEDYAKCMKAIDVISDCKEEGSVNTEEYSEIISYQKFEYEPTISDIINGERFAELPNKFENENVKYFFYVSCTPTDDMINLIYYCLISERINNAGILYIKAKNGKIASNIKDLLSNLLHNEEIGECYLENDGQYKKIDGNNVRILKQFSPIFKLEEKKNSAAFWRQSVNSFLIRLYRQNAIGTVQMQYGVNYGLPHILPSRLKGKEDEEIGNDLLKKQEFRLLQNCVECFCDGDKKPGIRILRDRYLTWKSLEFFEIVKDMPFLALYIFCISDYFRKGKNGNSKEEIEREIFDARDMTDGLLQILENVYHSERRTGFFCFRVHNTDTDRGRGYLESQYKDYLKSEIEHKMAQNYLEVKIVDYSRFTIPMQFYKKFQEHMEKANVDEQALYMEIENDAKEMKVKSFFEVNSFWDKYNTISENIVHHYGLQIFDSAITSYGGYFSVRSHGGYSVDIDKDTFCSDQNYSAYLPEMAIPGTQYDILIPFHEHKFVHDTSLNVNINYTDYLLTKFEIIKSIPFTYNTCSAIFNQVSKELSYQDRKEETIQILARMFEDNVKEKHTRNSVIHYSTENLSLSMVELFCKALMLYISKSDNQQDCYVMITECNQSYFMEITRMMALFYNKKGCNLLMKGTQIFLAGSEAGEEFLISGRNLGEIVGSTEKLSFARCVHPNCLKILKKMLLNHSMGVQPNEVISIVPFDMLRFNENKQTIFERNVQAVLMQNIQSEKFGCKLENLHVRIGSKIHVHTFYEAELLFHNSYYTSRFAYWLLEELRYNSQIDLKAPLTLVGYENYSEMLVGELRNLLEKIGVKSDYIIYEQKANGKFRGNVSFEEYMNHQFVIIVPINSTLTTHIKVIGFLEQEIRNALKKIDEEKANSYILKNYHNYGVILISNEDGEGGDYWETDKKTRNTIVSKLVSKRTHFFIKVESRWSNRLECKDCFPDKDYTQELPLVETNKESVVPMHAIGIRKEDSSYSIKRVDSNERAKLDQLSNFLVYRHITRNGNHFNYYFSTEKLWDFPEIRGHVQDWLKEKKDLFSLQTVRVYDIIAAPLHFSNTVFVEEVNEFLFSNAALVLHFDVDREFRTNIRTKFSSIQQLYDNLCEDQGKSIINFHYVDDTIISGRTFFRTKSLIQSMVKERDNANVELNIFRSIILLLNRLSISSIRNYIDTENYFLAYFNLNISSMRVNSDACVLCKKYDEWNQLAELASLNVVYEYWKKKSNKIECCPVEDLGRSSWKDDEVRQKRAKQYMIASHCAKTLIEGLCNVGTKEEICEAIVEELFPQTLDETTIEEWIAVLKVLGRPFLTFRKEEKEAVFGLMLTMLEVLLKKTPPAKNGKLNVLLKDAFSQKEYRTKLIIMLINRLAELESNYLIRKKNINRILNYSYNNINNLESRTYFEKNYLNRVKQIVGQSRDFTKCLFLECLLLYGKEYKRTVQLGDFVDWKATDSKDRFCQMLYLENNKLLDYGVRCLSDCCKQEDYMQDELIAKLNENYYFDNFIQYLNFHKMVEVDEKDKVHNFTSKKSWCSLKGMVQFQNLYQSIIPNRNLVETNFEKKIEERQKKDNSEELKNKFSEMMECLNLIGGASDGEIIIPYRGENEESEKYMPLGLSKTPELGNFVNNNNKLIELISSTIFEGDTYLLCQLAKGECGILLKFYDNVSQENANISVVYMLFSFAENNTENLIHVLKNLLCFRSKIWRILNLSSSTLLQNWTDNLFYKQQMLKSRATSHTDWSDLFEMLGKTARMLIEKKESHEILSEHFGMILNNIIGYLNTQILGGEKDKFIRKAPLSVKGFLKSRDTIIKGAELAWDVEIVWIDDFLSEDYTIRKISKQNNKIPLSDALIVIILAAIQNATKHGKMSKKKYIISIYAEGNALCISNEIDPNKLEDVKKSVSYESHRSGIGISKAVIFDLCCSWYPEVSHKEIFGIQQKNTTKEQFYVVKLPILESNLVNSQEVF